KNSLLMVSANYWDDRYRNRETGWDIGYASPPLTHYIDQLTNRSIRILIPGCGNAYEAEYLLRNGFTNVTVIDIAHTLTAKLARELKPWNDRELRILTGDFFTLQGEFDLILEQTFFCALDPSLRENYAAKMAELLAPGGKLVGVLFDHPFEGGPPFGGSKSEYGTIFANHFATLRLDPCYNSIAPRRGRELFIRLSHPVKSLPTGSG
ncbi:MAG TPA: methyltransferase domain-containing protein, partial [Flavihumibacter sp.]